MNAIVRKRRQAALTPPPKEECVDVQSILKFDLRTPQVASRFKKRTAFACVYIWLSI